MDQRNEMRLCSHLSLPGPCGPDSISDSGKQHLEKYCKNVSKSTVDSHLADLAKRKEDPGPLLPDLRGTTSRRHEP